jgi:hypothetical protein
MAGMYRKISLRTPLREVKTVEPVKLSARKAESEVTISRLLSAAPAALHQAGGGLARASRRTSGRAVTTPRRKP